MGQPHAVLGVDEGATLKQLSERLKVIQARIVQTRNSLVLTLEQRSNVINRRLDERDQLNAEIKRRLGSPLTPPSPVIFQAPRPQA